jgi:hypothetical protein
MSDFDASVEKLVARDPRYPREAYLYLRAALDFTQLLHNRSGHVSVTELLEGIRQYTLKEYGPMSLLLRKTEQDRREDFAAGFDFNDAFRRPFLPSSVTRTV